MCKPPLLSDPHIKRSSVNLNLKNKMKHGFLFINDKSNINFIADMNDMSLNGPAFTTDANSSLKKFIATNDSMVKKLRDASAAITQLQQAGAKPGDSLFIACETNF